jgi:hypothetical protein
MTQPRISASRVALMLNESKWGTPLSLYHEMRGEAPPKDDNEVLEEGRAFEPVILRLAAKKFRMPMVNGPKELIHGDLIAHPDGYVIDEHGMLAVAESKNLLFADVGEESGWGEADTDRVPMAYWYQCQTYGHLLLKQRVGDLFDLNGPPWKGVSDTVYLFARLWHGLRRYRIKVDPVVCARIELEASAFLDRVARGEPPDPETGKEFRQRWSPVEKKLVDFTAREWEILKVRQQLKAQVKLAEAEIEKLDCQLLGYMGDAAGAKWEGKTVLSAVADRKFDVAAFAKEHPDLWETLRSFDPAMVKEHDPAMHERYLKHPPAKEQTRKLRPSKALEKLL